jgi:diguanylate cyclase (GGDEF)-like protein/PAS domain S-box-containing protein
LAGCFSTVILAVLFTGLFDRQGAFCSLIWVANGLLLAFMLLAPRWLWPAYLGAGFAGMFVASALLHELWRMNLLYCLLNIAEVVIGALLLRRRSTELPRFTELGYLLRFLGFAVVTGPAATGLIFALVLGIWQRAAPVDMFLRWVLGDCLGIAIATPICVAIFRTRFKESSAWKERWCYLAAFTAVTIGAFAQTQVPLLFFIYPFLILILLRLGMRWASLSMVLVVASGGWFSAHGVGPLAMSTVLHGSSVIQLQGFVAAAVFMLYSVSVVLERKKASERELKRLVAIHNMVVENSRDIIVISDLYCKRKYVSPTCESAGGWTAEELLEHGIFGLCHPDDLEKVKAAVEDLSCGCEGSMIEVRARKKDGDYHWIECCLRPIRDAKSGLPTGVLNIIRDVTERKVAAQSREFQHSLIRAIHEVTLDGILVVNNQGNVISLNKRFFEIWKIPAPHIPESMQEKFIDFPSAALLSQVDDRVIDSKAFIKRIQELYADPDADDHSQIELKDGRTLERYSASLCNDEGKELGRVWFYRDISERKLTEQKLQEAYDAVESLAITDGLTGLANRRHFDHYLTNEWRRSLRASSPLSLLMIDADLFKSYNDTYGHLRGDNCLKQIAEAIRDVVSRPGDLIARYGGEEFSVILPNTENEGAMQVAKEICESMSNRRLPHTGNPNGIMTISVGCATMVPSFGQHAANLIEMADKALYQAKRGGRNQACNANAIEGESGRQPAPITAKSA